MKNYKFSVLFVFCSWVIFIAAEKNITSSVLLMLSGLYALCNVISELRKRLMNNAKR